MVARNSQTTSKYPRNKQDNRNKHTFANSPADEVGEFKGGSFVLPGDKCAVNSIEESRPKMKSNSIPIRDFKDGYFVERTGSPQSPELQKKNNTEKLKKETTPVLLTPAHLKSQSLPHTFVPQEKKAPKTRKVQDFILMTSQNIVVPNSKAPLERDDGYASPPSPLKWASGAYSNSPPAKHLPYPRF